ncbi:MAG TPA: hypothetical protein H9671_01830 [Firmicutes bacterium]|nr:hypothetical protein [Bacillota bacterium]
MDTFVEQLVKKQSTSADMLKRAGIVGLGALLFVLIIRFSRYLGVFSMIGYLLSAGVLYGAYYLWTSLNIEYEYILTNDEIDIDKIVAQRKRNRLLTVNIRDFEQFGLYNAAEHAQDEERTKVFACSSPTAPNAYYATFTHRKYGKTLLVFNPDIRIVEGVKKFLPAQKIQNL